MVEERTTRLETALAEAQRQREQAERANESKSVFLAHMSHEIRTPLNGVLGLNELALREATSTQQKRYLKLALQSGRNLLGIINDVLDFSRLSAGMLPPVDEPFDLCDTLTEAMRAVMPTVRTQGLGLIYDHIGSDQPRDRRPTARAADRLQPAVERGEVHRAGSHRTGHPHAGGIGRTVRGTHRRCATPVAA